MQIPHVPNSVIFLTMKLNSFEKIKNKHFSKLIYCAGFLSKIEYQMDKEKRIFGHWKIRIKNIGKQFSRLFSGGWWILLFHFISDNDWFPIL